jgi:hypothetical protein
MSDGVLRVRDGSQIRWVVVPRVVVDVVDDPAIWDRTEVVDPNAAVEQFTLRVPEMAALDAAVPAAPILDRRAELAQLGSARRRTEGLTRRAGTNSPRRESKIG